MVDPNVPRFNQSMIALLTAVAFVTGWWGIVPALAVVLAAGSLLGLRAMLFGQVYVRLVRPRLGGRPPRPPEPAAPPRFAQTRGASLLALATACFLAGWFPAGWVLTVLVCIPALLGATTGFCLGCEIYVLAARLRGRTA